MAQQMEIHTLVERQTIDASGGNIDTVSGVIELGKKARVESLLVKATSVAGTPSFDLEWAGGVNSVFQAFGQNTALVTDSATVYGANAENLQIIALPAPLSPQIKFRLRARSGSPSDAQYECYAYVREDYE